MARTKEETSKHLKEKRERMIAAGICLGTCGGRPAEDGLQTCKKCRDRDKKYRNGRIKEGLCQVCLGRPVENGNAKTCADCKASVKIREARRKEKLAKAGICYQCGKGKLINSHACIDCSCKSRDRAFGLPSGTFKELYLPIENCQACGIKISFYRDPYAKKPHLDHDHVSGKVRGLLCHGCNTALGMMEESPTRIRALADYIEKHK